MSMERDQGTTPARALHGGAGKSNQLSTGNLTPALRLEAGRLNARTERRWNDNRVPGRRGRYGTDTSLPSPCTVHPLAPKKEPKHGLLHLIARKATLEVVAPRRAAAVAHLALGVRAIVVEGLQVA